MRGLTDILPPRYEDVELIGRGGMGDIYRATDSTLGRDVAIKVLAERFAQDESVRSRFKREALAAARLSGAPSTVTIFDVGEHDSTPFIVMEYLAGGSLEDRLRDEGAQPPGRALAWLEQAAAALDAAHRDGIVHRDVKPANLLLDAEENVHVADFGVASAAGMASLTKTGTVLGTAGYLAPEQAMGERATPASDRYALAVVAWELLTGSRPFAADSPTAEAAAHVHAPVPAISEHGLPRELDTVFARALAKDPAERFDSCAELVAEIRAALGRSDTTTRRLAPVPPPAPVLVPEPPPTAATRVAAGAPPPRSPEAAPPSGRRRSPWPLVLAAALAAVLAGAGLAAVLADDDGGGGGEGGTASTLVTTIRETAPGTTEQVTVTATVPQDGEGEGDGGEGGGEGGGSIEEAIALTDQATGLLGEGRNEEALAAALRALEILEGTGHQYEAYANYDAGRALASLGRCEEALPYLDRSEQLQGQRDEIDQARADCEGDGD
jgi:eukaryotic-like serine/threonine-protein kinase